MSDFQPNHKYITLAKKQWR